MGSNGGCTGSGFGRSKNNKIGYGFRSFATFLTSKLAAEKKKMKLQADQRDWK